MMLPAPLASMPTKLPVVAEPVHWSLRRGSVAAHVVPVSSVVIVPVVGVGPAAFWIEKTDPLPGVTATLLAAVCAPIGLTMVAVGCCCTSTPNCAFSASEGQARTARRSLAMLSPLRLSPLCLRCRETTRR